MNIFSAIHVYPGAWAEKARRAFSEEEIKQVKSAKVVDSNYGSSVCFTMVSGGKAYIPLSNTSNLHVGDDVDLSSAELLTLGRKGDADIYRVQA